MILIEFPIIDPLRAPLLIIEWIFTLTCFELGFIFLIKYKKQKEERKNLQELGYALLFIGFSLMIFFFIISDYYLPDDPISPFLIWKEGSLRALVLNIGYISLQIGALLFIYYVEYYKKYLIRKYFFTYTFLLFIIIVAIFFFIDIKITQNLNFIFWPLFFLFFLIYIIDFVKKVQNKEKVLFGVLKILPSFLLLGFGFMLTTDFVIMRLGLEFRLIGSTIQLIGIILIFNFFLHVPALAELDWQDKIEELFLLNKAGVCLYHESFVEKIDFYDEHLMSGAIQTINIMLKELKTTGKEGAAIIKKRGKTVNIFSSKYVSGVLFSTEELKFINFNLKKFVQEFEEIFQSVLINWNGDPDVFKPVKNLVNDIFYK